MMAAGHGLQSATGPVVTSALLARGEAAKRFEIEDEEGEKRDEKLRRAQEQVYK